MDKDDTATIVPIKTKPQTAEEKTKLILSNLRKSMATQSAIYFVTYKSYVEAGFSPDQAMMLLFNDITVFKDE